MTDKSPVNRCPTCGGPIRADTVGGHCPRCLIRRLSAAGPASAPASFPPTDLADYELEEIIGRGGMGVVWRARQKKLNRPVAVKFLAGGGWSSEAARGRLRAEAVAAARLRHPGIVPVFDLGESDDGPWISMEFVPGQSLAEKLVDGPLAPRAAAALMLAVTEAVAHAHHAGVLHRDLKPGNILLDPVGQPHVTDFGLARVRGAEHALTQTGQVLGSPAYLAPEILQGESATELGDVYALGATLYHALTGRPPFEAPTIEATLGQVAAAEPIPPRRLHVGIPIDLETIVLVCLQKTPARRYASTGHLAEDLARFLAGRPIAARPVSPAEKLGRWCRRRPATTALLALLLVGTALSFWRINALRHAERRERDRAERSLAELQVKTRDLATAESHLAASNVQLTESLERLHLERIEDLFDQDRLSDGLSALARRLETKPPSRLAAARLAGLLWHQDVARLAGVPHFFFEKMLRVVTHPSQPIAFAGAEGGRLWRLRPHNGASPGQPEAIEGRHFHDRMTFSGDGSALALVRRDDPNSVLVVSPTARQLVPHRLDHGGPVQSACFTPTADLAVTFGRDGLARWWQQSSTNAGSYAPTGVLHRHGRPIHQAALAPHGTRLMTAGEDGSLRWWQPHEAEPVARDRLDRSPLTAFAASRDGALVAVGTADGEVALWNLADATRLAARLSLPSRIRALTIAPDGKTLAAGTADGHLRLMRLPEGTVVAPDLILSGVVRELAFSPDSLQIAVCTESSQVRVIDAKGRPILQSLTHAERAPSAAFLAPGHILLVASAEGTVRKWDLRPSRHQEQILTEPGPDPTFAGGRLLSQGAEALTWTPGGLVRRWPLPANDAFPRSVLPAATPPPLLSGHDRLAFALVSPNESLLARGSTDGTIQLLHLGNLDRGSSFSAAPPLPSPPVSAAFSPDSQWLVAGARNGAIRIWRAADGSAGPTVPGHSAEVRALVFSPDGRWLVSASHDRSAHFLQWLDPKATPVVVRHHDVVTSAVLWPDGQSLLTSSHDRQVVRWDLATGIQREILHRGTIERLLPGPDGRCLALIPTRGDVHLAYAASPQRSVLARNTAAGVLTVAFSPDGLRLATGGRDGTARVWDVASGLPLTPPLRHRGPVQTVQFFPEGLRLFTVSQDGTARVWPAPAIPETVPPWGAKLPRLLAGELTEEERANPLGSLLLWEQMETELRAAPDSDPLGAVARWFGRRFEPAPANPTP